MASLESQCRAASSALDPPLQVPRSFGRERYILHLFAGRRRLGDFQFFIDRLQERHGSATFHVLSVDIVIDTGVGVIFLIAPPNAFGSALSWTA